MITSRVNIDFEFIDPCLCNAWVATAIIGGSALAGIASGYSANVAADAQQSAAAQAANTQLSMYNTTRGDLAPFRQIGSTAADQLTAQLPQLTAPVSVNQNDFLNSPAYNFLQSTGMKAVTNSAAARGLGTSGAALKGADTFESGLNSQFYQQDFNNQVTNQTNAYNRLKGLVDTGENAAAQTGTAGTAAAGGAASAEIAGGNAAAAGANAIGTAATNVAGAVPTAFLTSGLYGKLNQPSAAPAASSLPLAPGQAGSPFFGPVAP
jgi:hypothetical protein